MLRLLRTVCSLCILLKLHLQEKFRNFWLNKVVFFKDLHWNKMIKPFDFPEAEVGNGWEIVDWCVVLYKVPE